MTLLALLACPAAPPLPPLAEAVLVVEADLDLARERATDGDPGSAESVAAAYERFEATVEPRLRERLSPVDVLRLEVAFARAAAAKGDAIAPAFEALAAELEAASRAAAR